VVWDKEKGQKMWGANGRRAMIVAVVLSSLAVAGTAEAGIKGNLLLEWCQADTPDPGLHFTDLALCRGYIVGVSDALTLMNQRLLCVPEGVDGGQEIDILKLWLRDHPEKRHLPAVGLVAAALNEKFPCKAQ
jgi:hypothetical protein